MSLNIIKNPEEILMGNNEIDIIQNLMNNHHSLSLRLGVKPRAGEFKGATSIDESEDDIADIHFNNKDTPRKYRWFNENFEFCLNMMTHTLYINSKYTNKFGIDISENSRSLHRIMSMNHTIGGLDEEINLSGILWQNYSSDEQYKIFKKFDMEHNCPKSIIIQNSVIDSRDYNLNDDMLIYYGAKYIDFSGSTLYVDDYFNNLRFLTTINKEVNLTNTIIHITNNRRGTEVDCALSELKRYKHIKSEGLIIDCQG